MIEPIANTWQWIREDWRSYPWRFVIEVICWFDSLACAIVVNTTVPNLPYMWLYPMWIGGTILYAWCAWSRGSFGMLATFVMLATIDSMGFIRYLWL